MILTDENLMSIVVKFATTDSKEAEEVLEEAMKDIKDGDIPSLRVLDSLKGLWNTAIDTVVNSGEFQHKDGIIFMTEESVKKMKYEIKQA